MGRDSVLLRGLSEFLYPGQDMVKDVFTLRGRVAADMNLTQISVNFVYKKTRMARIPTSRTVPKREES